MNTINLGQKFLKFDLRKDILRKNKKINHKAYTKAMWAFPKFRYLLGYHKKKTIFAIVVALIIYTYDLQKSIYKKVVQFTHPINWFLSWFIQEKAIPPTISEQNYAGIDLSKNTIDTLIKIYYITDREYFFGVGRYFLFEVYKQLGIIETEQNEKKFWISSGFFKERNQKASGVGLVQFLQIFQDGLVYTRKTKDASMSESEYLQKFLKIFIEKAPEIRKWEIQFNEFRMQEFIRNMPGDNMKKQEAILDLVRDTTQEKGEPLTLQELEKEIVKMGLRGLNYSDRYLYLQLVRVWKTVRNHSTYRKIKHPLTTELQRTKLQQQLQKNIKEAEKVQQIMNQLEASYKKSYQQDIV